MGIPGAHLLVTGGAGFIGSCFVREVLGRRDGTRIIVLDKLTYDGDRANLDTVEAGVRLQGASDHGVSEAVYLADPDNNGLELYWDRPREQWPRTPDGAIDPDPLVPSGVLPVEACWSREGDAVCRPRASFGFRRPRCTAQC